MMIVTSSMQSLMIAMSWHVCPNKEATTDTRPIHYIHMPSALGHVQTGHVQTALICYTHTFLTSTTEALNTT